MPVLNFCDDRRRHLRCKQPNEENNNAIDPNRNCSPRLAGGDLLPLIKPRLRRRRRRPKGAIRAEEQAEPAESKGFPIPDSLRCRRSDGRKWRCSQLAIPGLSFCEHHQMLKGSKFCGDLMRMEQHGDGIKEQTLCDEDRNGEEEEEEEELAGDLQASIKELPLPDRLRCRRSDGRKWRCTQPCMPKIGFCEYHYLQVRRNQGKRKNTKLEKRRTRLKRRKKEERDEGMEDRNVEVKRELPNGLMAISPAPARGPAANSSPLKHWKIGSDDGYLFGRRFRSKNAELVPLGKVVVVPRALSFFFLERMRAIA